MFNQHFIIIFLSFVNSLTWPGYSNSLFFGNLSEAITSETFLSFAYDEVKWSGKRDPFS